MSAARPSPIRLHVAIRRVARNAQAVYALGGFKPDLAEHYAGKLVRHLRRLRGVSEVMIAANLGPKHADAVRWARAICGEWHRARESGFSAERWEFVRRLLPMPDMLQETLRGELVAATPASTPPAEGQGRQKPRADARADRPKRDPNQPSRDRQNDILAAIRNAQTPLTRLELADAMRLKTEGKLGAHLAWLVSNGILVNIPQRGYWPTNDPAPE
jgi:hypothetical protein